MKLYDISLPLYPDMAVWPGDTPYAFHLTWRMEEGASVNLGSVVMGAHSGTHADAPFHFLPEGAPIDATPLSVYMGPALVVEVPEKSLITCRDLQPLDFRDTPRLLLKTGSWPDPSRFPDTIPVMDRDVPAFLHSQGVVLVGLDVPSVDALDSKDLPNHHALAGFGIHILESLNLAEVPEGRYELIALPLRMVGADGSPVRAVLRQM